MIDNYNNNNYYYNDSPIQFQTCSFSDWCFRYTQEYRQKLYTSFDKLLSSCWSLYWTVDQMDMYCTCVQTCGQLQITNYNYTFNFGFWMKSITITITKGLISQFNYNYI